MLSMAARLASLHLIRVQHVVAMRAAVYIWRTDSESSVCLPRAPGSYTPSEARLKSDSFEAFRGAPELCTVAMFVPAVPEPQACAPLPFAASNRSSVDTSGGGEVWVRACMLVTGQLAAFPSH
jgi:hypothetical protein